MGPAWFEHATAVEPDEGRVEVDGCGVHWLAWGPRGTPALVLVHGGAAHARWWAAHAPMLSHGRRVVAIDLSGHGDSGWREVYSAEQWADEVLAVAADAGGAGRPIVAGHSMGGFVAIVTAAVHGRELEGAIVLDSPVQRPDPESDEGQSGRRGFVQRRVHPDRETILGRFKLIPPQPCENDWILDYIARHSIREEPEGGFAWKFDPGVFVNRAGSHRPTDHAARLAQAACRVAVVNGEESAIVDDDVRAYMSGLLEGSAAAAAGVPFIEVPQARHHLLLDQPLATVTAIRGVLATWSPVGRAPVDVGSTPQEPDPSGAADER